MDDDKFFSLLGLCRRAGRLSLGHDASIGSIRNKTAKLCILSSDSSERLYSEILHEINHLNQDLPVIRLKQNMNEIGYAVGLKSAVLTVNDEGFAKKLISFISFQQV